MNQIPELNLQDRQIRPAENETAPMLKDKSYLSLTGLRKSYGGTEVVNSLNLQVAKGEFVSLLGPSGCGKTTTLRMIAGFIEVDQGDISLDGRRIDQVPSHKRGTAMVFQNYALFPHMTVEQNIAFGLRMEKRPKDEIRSRVSEVLKLVQLPALGKRYPKELSGGQQQRVALARAIVLNPKVLLLDEPLSNLDAKLRKDLRGEMREIQRKAGITTILVTHDLEEAISVSDRVAVMNKGRIEQYAAPFEIYSKPETAFVAEFVGHSNIIEGVMGAGGVMPFSAGNLYTIQNEGAGQAHRFAIPSHLVTVSSSPSGLANTFEGVLQHALYLGPLVQLDVKVGDRIIRGEVPVNASTQVPNIGDRLYIGWSREDLILLPLQASQLV